MTLPVKNFISAIVCCGLCFLLFAGCKKAANRGYAGMYVSEKNKASYLQLHEDGTFFSFDEGRALRGTYKVQGQSLVLEPSMPVRGALKNGTITTPFGLTWTRK